MKKLILLIICIFCMAIGAQARSVEKREVYECTFAQAAYGYTLQSVPEAVGNSVVVIYYDDGTISKDGKVFYYPTEESDTGTVKYTWWEGENGIFDKETTLMLNPLKKEFSYLIEYSNGSGWQTYFYKLVR